MVTKQTIIFQNVFDHLAHGLAYIDLRIRWAVVRARVHGLNPDDEFRGLYISETQIDSLLGQDIGASLWPAPNGDKPELAQWPILIEEARQAWLSTIFKERHEGDNLLPLQHLVQEFNLSSQELDILLLVTAPEIDPRYERLFSYLQDDITKKRPTINLILDLLTDSFHEKILLQNLFLDTQSLIAEGLLVLYSDNSQNEPTLLSQNIKPANLLQAYLLGQVKVDSRLINVANVVDTSLPQEAPELSYLPVQSLLKVLPHKPILGFTGSYGAGKWSLAYQIAHESEYPLLRLQMDTLMQSDVGLFEGLRLIQRDGRLHKAILYIEKWDISLKDNQPNEEIFKSLLSYPYPIIIASEQPWQPRYRTHTRRIIQLELDLPDAQNRLNIWEHHHARCKVDSENINYQVIANHFRFTPGQIRDAMATASDIAVWHEEPISMKHLLLASRAQSNQKLATLATKITPRYSWEDIVLPDDTLAQLHEMVNTFKNQTTIYQDWGFGKKLAIGKGLKALFAGEPGTGKTMSADILAYELGLDLYKIDLSTIVDKYIGETEKNIGRIFDEAATSNAILFFDEADSLFSKRSEVKDSHDRNANIQTGYLLQRMEAFDGVVILATNLRSNIDEAFTRRLHFLVEFQFPNVEDRERIWRVTYPAQTPIGDVDFKLLAERFRLAGGNIRNIVLASAFLAAKDDGIVQMSHILHATRREYQKMGRLIKETLFM